MISHGRSVITLVTRTGQSFCLWSGRHYRPAHAVPDDRYYLAWAEGAAYAAACGRLPLRLEACKIQYVDSYSMLRWLRWHILVAAMSTTGKQLTSEQTAHTWLLLAQQVLQRLQRIIQRCMLVLQLLHPLLLC